MGKFRDWLREAETKNEKSEQTEQTEYQKFFAKKLEKFGVKSPAELSDEDKTKFFDEIDAEWEGEKKEVEPEDVNEAKKYGFKIGDKVKTKNIEGTITDIDYTTKELKLDKKEWFKFSEIINEAKQMVDKKQLEWFIGLANKAKDLDSFIDDLNLMKGLVK